MITIDRRTTLKTSRSGPTPTSRPLNQVPNGTLRSHRLLQGQVARHRRVISDLRSTCYPTTSTPRSQRSTIGSAEPIEEASSPVVKRIPLNDPLRPAMSS